MSDEAAFVRAIMDQPGDDLARLVYADWLDEFGTTDQQRARSEWIRMTCWDRGKRTQQPSGSRQRMAGEPNWIRLNAHRLWPNLFELHARWPNHRETPSMALLTGRIVVSLALEIDGKTPGEKRLDYTHVGIEAERGVASCVSVTFLRAGLVAPAAATDERCAELVFASIPERCYEFGNGELDVARRPFALRGLGRMFDRIDGGHALLDDHEPAKSFPQPNTTFSTAVAVKAVNRALTDWARAQAARAPGTEVAE